MEFVGSLWKGDFKNKISPTLEGFRVLQSASECSRVLYAERCKVLRVLNGAPVFKSTCNWDATFVISDFWHTIKEYTTSLTDA